MTTEQAKNVVANIIANVKSGKKSDKSKTKKQPLPRKPEQIADSATRPAEWKPAGKIGNVDIFDSPATDALNSGELKLPELPDFLKVENREELTPEQKAKLDETTKKQRAESVEVQQQSLREKQAETKKEKARVRVEKLKAKKSGAAAKMPLTGKDALRAIAQDAVENGKIAIQRVPQGVTWASAQKRSGAIPKSEKAAPKSEHVLGATGKSVGAPKGKRGSGVAPSAKKRASDRPNGSGKGKKGSGKTEIALKLMQSAKGATREELCKATGWVGVSVPGLVKRAGLKLTKTKDESGVIRYRAA